MATEIVTRKDRPLRISRETKTLFENLHPNLIGLIEKYEARGLIIVEED